MSTADDISEFWKCLTCQSTVAVYAEDFNGRRQVLNRLSPSELREDFQVVRPYGLEHIYSIICITPQNRSFRVALRGYRVVVYEPDAIIECVIGAW
jgi:hypothetical protein